MVPMFEYMRNQRQNQRSTSPILVAGLLALTFGSWLRAEDVTVTGSIEPGQCSTWAWADQEKVPIFDPLASPDSEASRQQIRELDGLIRSTVEGLIRKRGWQKASPAACQVSYSLIQDLDLDVARYETGGMVPGNIVDSGGRLDVAGTDSYMRKKGTFTLDISTGDPAVRIWRGTLADSLGHGKEVSKNSLKLVKEVTKSVPKR